MHLECIYTLDTSGIFHLTTDDALVVNVVSSSCCVYMKFLCIHVFQMQNVYFWVHNILEYNNYYRFVSFLLNQFSWLFIYG